MQRGGRHCRRLAALALATLCLMGAVKAHGDQLQSDQEQTPDNVPQEEVYRTREDLLAEAMQAEFHQKVLPSDPNIEVARRASQDLLDLQATPQLEWAADVTLANDGVRPEPGGPQQQQGQKEGQDETAPVQEEAAAQEAAAQDPEQEGAELDVLEHAARTAVVSEAAPGVEPVLERAESAGVAESASVVESADVAEDVIAAAATTAMVPEVAIQEPVAEQPAAVPSLDGGEQVLQADMTILDGPTGSSGTTEAAPEGASVQAQRRLLIAAVTCTGSNSNKAGDFTGGCNPLQHMGGLADSPNSTDPNAYGGSTSSTGSTGLDPKLAASLANDLKFRQLSGTKAGRKLAEAEGTADVKAGDFELPADQQAQRAVNIRAILDNPPMFPHAEAAAAAGFGGRAQRVAEHFGASDAIEASAAGNGAAEEVPADDQAGEHWQRAADKREIAEISMKDSVSRNRKLISGRAAQAHQTLIPGAASAQMNDKPLFGLTYSWRRADDCDAVRRVCQCPHPDDLERDLDIMHKYARRIRTYSMECPDLLRMLGHYSTVNADQVAWMAGVWIGRDEKANQAQLKLLRRLLEEYPNAHYYAIAVGNEVLMRGDASQADLIRYVQQVRDMLREISEASGSQTLAATPVTTAEAPWSFTPALAEALDALAINLHPFYTGYLDTQAKGWEAIAAGSAVYHLNSVRKQFRDKPVLVSEVGWPSQSGIADTNTGSADTAKAFAKAWLKAAKSHDVPYFWHEAFDAAWKGKLRGGDDGSVLGDEHFGLVSADRSTDKGLLP